LGRNVFYGPQLYGWDMGLFKAIRIDERAGMQFRVEMFNIFNQTNFANPNASATGAGFGNITSTNSAGGDPRIIQFGLKLSFLQTRWVIGGHRRLYGGHTWHT